MTTDVMQMTAEQLRLEIAKYKHPEYSRFWTIDRYLICGQKVDGITEQYTTFTDPNWPVDIAAAWGLVEEIIGTSKKRPRMRWDGHEWEFSTDHLDPVFYDQSLALAICRAWLMWKEATK